MENIKNNKKLYIISSEWDGRIELNSWGCLGEKVKRKGKILVDFLEHAFTRSKKQFPSSLFLFFFIPSSFHVYPSVVDSFTDSAYLSGIIPRLPGQYYVCRIRASSYFNIISLALKESFFFISNNKKLEVTLYPGAWWEHCCLYQSYLRACTSYRKAHRSGFSEILWWNPWGRIYLNG